MGKLQIIQEKFHKKGVFPDPDGAHLRLLSPANLKKVESAHADAIVHYLADKKSSTDTKWGVRSQSA